MKLYKIHTLLLLAISVNIFAQAPQKMSYQATLRNSSGNLISNKSVKVRVSLLQGSENGTIAYQETHSTATNVNGLVSIDIGAGNVTSGNFSAINWGSGSYYVKTETDPNGGNNFTIVGSRQLVSVPYAFYAEKSGNATSGNNSSTWTQENYSDGVHQADYQISNNNIKATSVSGRDILNFQDWNDSWSRMPNSALNVYSNSGSLSVDGTGIQSNKWDDALAENAPGNLYLNKFGGNTAIGYRDDFSAPQSTLSVRRGVYSPAGTATFEGTSVMSHFSYGDDEHTYIRGGKNLSNVYINDITKGNIFLGNNQNNVLINQGDAYATSTLSVRKSNGATATAEFYPNAGNFNNALNCASTFNYSYDDGTGHTNSTFIRGGVYGARVWINDGHPGDVIIANGGGNVGIGTTNPTYKLAVNGTIRAKEIRVNTNWADYVFENDYKLKPLSEVEQYIKEHKHLPDVPSAKEIEGENNGLNVGEMSKIFMQKIEELTLYIIEANKKIEALEKQNELLSKEISKK